MAGGGGDAHASCVSPLGTPLAALIISGVVDSEYHRSPAISFTAITSGLASCVPCSFVYIFSPGFFYFEVKRD